MSFNTLLLSIFLLTAFSSFCQEASDSIRFTLTANNLSEDKNILSTKNDEIIFQIYASNDSVILDEPLVFKTLLFDEQRRTIAVSAHKDLFQPDAMFFLYLTEYEYDKTYEQRTPVYRIYYERINAAYKNGSALAVKKYLDSDDLLGFRELGYEELMNGLSIGFEGVQNLERFDYTIKTE